MISLCFFYGFNQISELISCFEYTLNVQYITEHQDTNVQCAFEFKRLLIVFRALWLVESEMRPYGRYFGSVSKPLQTGVRTLTEGEMETISPTTREKTAAFDQQHFTFELWFTLMQSIHSSDCGLCCVSAHCKERCCFNTKYTDFFSKKSFVPFDCFLFFFSLLSMIVWLQF